MDSRTGRSIGVFIPLVLLALCALVCVTPIILFTVSESYYEWQHTQEMCASTLERTDFLNPTVSMTVSLADVIDQPLTVISASSHTELRELATFDRGGSRIRFNGDQLETYPRGFEYAGRFARSPDGQLRILIEHGASESSTIFVCKDNGDALHSFFADETTNTVRFHPNGDRFGLNGGRGTLLIYDAQNFALISRIDAREGRRWRRTSLMEFDPVENLIAFVIDGEEQYQDSIWLWDVDNGERIWSFDTQTNILSLNFNQEGTLLASSSEGGKIRVWSIPSE